jgi:sortase A
MTSSRIRVFEKALLFAGAFLITLFVAAYIHKALFSRATVESFKIAKQSREHKSTASLWDKQLTFDSRLWSSKRIAAYEESLAAQFAPPLAILRIRKIHLEVPVLSGTDDLALNRGVGHIAGTNRPGEGGRIGIAGHRDGFFRGLKDVGPGDMLELETLERVDLYRIDEIVIVKPNDVSVLQPTTKPTLSLVTCYPFYFMGSAPQRYIVTASLVGSGRVPEEVNLQPNTSGVRSESEPTKAAAQSQELIKETTQ